MNDRAAAWLDAGLRHRLWFSEDDEHDGGSLPFGLCRRGDVVLAHNVSCGAIEGREIRMFDLDVMVRDDERGFSHGPERMIAGMIVEAFDDHGASTHVVTERWECAMVRAAPSAGGSRWRLRGCSPCSPTSCLWAIRTSSSRPPTGRSRCAPTTARSRTTSSIRAWSSSSSSMRAEVVETVGNRILVARPAGAIPDVDTLLALVLIVADRVPTVVKSLHPATPAAELTPECPVGPDGAARENDERETGADRFDPWPDVPSGWA